MIRRVHSARGVSRKLVSQHQCKQWEVNNPTCICSAEPWAAAFIPGDRFWSHYCCLVAQSCMALCNLMDCSTPGFSVPHCLLEFAQTHVHWVKDAIQPSHLLLLLLLSHFSRVRLCDPMDSSPPGSPVPGILQARTLEWVAISFSNAWKRKVIVKSLSRVRLLATPWTAAFQAPPSMGFSRQEYWSGVPLPSPLNHL